ncbi:MAG: AAA family ATPase [bacterium]|nr:AAA family ATPase [bacterium]
MAKAQIIAAVNQKGGPGKTTIAMHLAGTLARRGSKVLVVDADPQGTATRWAASASDEAPFPASIAGLADADEKLHREVKKFVFDYDFIVIDCPPSADSPVSQSALLIADLGLVPVIPSPPDLWAGVAIRKVIEAASGVNDQLQARLLINQRKPNTRLAAKTLELLPQYRIPLCRTQIGDREAYRHAAAYGQTVHHLGSEAAPAIREIEELVDEVLSVIQPGDLENEQRSFGRRTRQIAAR